ncbi:hypothetical protein D9Q98_004498 [Chlorella vulgaris]|uniref:F-box domain-containing protein n=1 Tax=Chlorella vulgaris TaxID=3077 RepID=A0A9D4YX52_CHLVU|nr:hypothetical protein D9Q98_004498 [Chlorella vulgaris]
MAPAAEAFMSECPDEILLNILANLSLVERRSIAVLVCKRWSRLADSPDLLRVLDFTIPDNETTEKAQDIASWLLDFADGHVQRLRVHYEPDYCSDNEMEELAFDSISELLDTVPFLNSGSQLVDLRLEVERNFGFLELPPSFVWAQKLGSLRRLHFTDEGAHGTVKIGSAMKHLTSLEVLHLASFDTNMPPSTAFPISITRLVLGNFVGSTLPRQVTQLTRLHSLRLYDWQKLNPSEAYDPLEHLPALRRLEVHGCNLLPACLRRLTNLDALHIIDSPCGTGPAIKTSMLQCELQPLTQLTQLALELVPAVPSAVAGMARLERFGCNPPAKARIVLPVGSQWLGGLRDLALPAATLADLLQVLSGATRLESLVCGGLFAEHVTTQLAS